MSDFPEGTVAFTLSADIDPDLFGGGLCVAGGEEFDLAELLEAGDGYIATARPALIELLSSLAAFVRVDPDDAPSHALVEGFEPILETNPLDNPGTYKVPEVLEAFASATPEQVAATQDLERDGRERAGILNYEPPAPETSDEGDGEQGDTSGEATTDDSAGDGGDE